MPWGEISATVIALADAVAWPLVAIILLCTLRPYLQKLGPLIRTIRYKDIEVSFKEDVQGIADKVESLPEATAPTIEPVEETVSTDPRITILKSWATVETAIQDFARVHKDALGRIEGVSTRRRIQLLRQANLVDSPLAGVLNDMRGLRNLIAHGEDIPISDDTVLLFSKAAELVTSIVEEQINSSTRLEN